MLFDRPIPVILTSATLTVQNSLLYYRKRVGFTGGEELVLSSPFNYEQQVKLYLSRQIPEPNQPGYEDTIIRFIDHLIEKTHGKAFVLFTSYRMLETCADALRDSFDEKGLQLLVQGGDLSRSAMLEVFKQDTNSIIFGTTSFWTGVDVPGEALSNVIIPKLPFSVPTHPLIQARCEWVEHHGGRSFMDYSLPEAVLKFRQGVGRLIRSNSDTGIVAILDKRVISKRYGSMFLNSIPKVTIEMLNL
jgi:ATP-dependent DNA helicase DinG